MPRFVRRGAFERKECEEFHAGKYKVREVQSRYDLALFVQEGVARLEDGLCRRIELRFEFHKNARSKVQTVYFEAPNLEQMRLMVWKGDSYRLIGRSKGVFI